MKKLTTLLQYVPRKTLVVIAAVAVAIAIPAVLFAWGPSRPTYTIEHPADHVVFNSITNNPVQGDERNFVQIKDDSASNSTYVDSISLTAGHEYDIFVYYHNNASSSLNDSGVGIAKGAYVKAQIPAAVLDGSNGTKAVAYVGASNANPAEVWDDVSFTNSTGGDIGLTYVPGSATIYNFGKTNGMKLSDNIVTTGATLGFDALDGVIPGCEHYSGYVIFKLKANQPNFTVTKQVRKSGDTTWLSSVTVNPGDQVDFLITYRNTGTMTQESVFEYDTLPAGISYVDSSTYVANTSNPNGIKVSDRLTTSMGVNIGDYTTGAAAYTKFTAKVAPNDSLKNCGENTLTNVAKVQTGNGSKEASATVEVNKTCKTPPVTPPVLPQTGAGENIAAFLGLGALVTAFSYYRASRKTAIVKR